MKKFLAILFLISITSSVFANQCPAPETVVVKSGTQYIIKVPNGWYLAFSNNVNSTVVSKSAEWGNHVVESDHVRCSYSTNNGGYGKLQLNTVEMHRQPTERNWYVGDLYSSCSTGKSVYDCKFF